MNLFAVEQYDPEYLKINSKGVVPILVHEGRANKLADRETDNTLTETAAAAAFEIFGRAGSTNELMFAARKPAPI